MEFTTKTDLINFLNAVLWTLKNLEAQGTLPDKKEVQLKFPQLSSESVFGAIASYAGTLASEEIKERAGRLVEEIQALRDTFLNPHNLPENIKKVPKEVSSLPFFAKDSEEIVKKRLTGFLQRLTRQEIPVSEGENLPPLFTFATNSADSPLYDEVAKIFFNEGLVNRAGRAKDDYAIKLERQEFKKKLETRVAEKILERDLTEQIASGVEESFLDWGLDSEELDLGKRLLSEKFAEGVVKEAGLDNEKLKKACLTLSEKTQNDSRLIQELFEELLTPNQKIPQEERGSLAQKATRALQEALAVFEPVAIYTVSINPKSASFTLFAKDLSSGKSSQEEFVVFPKEQSDFERDYEREKRDFEIIFSSQMTKV